LTLFYLFLSESLKHKHLYALTSLIIQTTSIFNSVFLYCYPWDVGMLSFPD